MTTKSRNPYKNTLWKLVETQKIGYFQAREILDSIFSELVLKNPNFEKMISEKMKNSVFALIAQKHEINQKIKDSKKSGVVVTTQIGK